MAYFKDPIIEAYLKNLGVAGEVMPLAKDFFGDYLAVVNANIAGGKSDAFVGQTIKLTSKFQSDGQIRNQLFISREHNGQNEKDWWYRSTNRDYIQVFVPPGSKLTKVTGATPKTIKPIANYKDKNFSIDQDLVQLEGVGSELFGKTIFARWLEVKAGTAKELKLEYLNPYHFNFKPGPYQFIFEKQSGVGGSLTISLEAPPGFQWKETGSAIFNYSNEDLPARIVLDLNLVPLEVGRP
jgi:hypothetical protein